MPSIDVTVKVKENLDKVMKEQGIKTYSDVVHFLLFFYDVKKTPDSE